MCVKHVKTVRVSGWAICRYSLPNEADIQGHRGIHRLQLVTPLAEAELGNVPKYHEYWQNRTR